MWFCEYVNDSTFNEYIESRTLFADPTGFKFNKKTCKSELNPDALMKLEYK